MTIIYIQVNIISNSVSSIVFECMPMYKLTKARRESESEGEGET